MELVVLIFRLHQREKTYILSTTNYMVTWIKDIITKKHIANTNKLGRPENMSVDNFVDNMELILNCVTDMKKEM